MSNEPTLTLPEAVCAILYALEFPQHIKDYGDIAFLLEQRPGPVRKIVRRWEAVHGAPTGERGERS